MKNPFSMANSLPVKNIFLLAWILFSGYACSGNKSDSERQMDSFSVPFCHSIAPTEILTSTQDSLLYHQFINHEMEVVEGKPAIADQIIHVARLFKSTPYVASTLEVTDKEQLVINLGELDCTTFVEYVLAISLASHYQQTNFEDFSRIITCLRYRDGIIDEYPSRLHYFTEWLQQHVKNGLLELTSDKLGSKPFNTEVSFMSSNPHLYQQLDNPDFIEEIKKVEKRISSFTMNYIPKDEISELENKIMDGDIIAFTTDIPGLDVSHNGFAYHHKGRLHLLHASTRKDMVEITPIPLSRYIAPMANVTGILVARLTPG